MMWPVLEMQKTDPTGADKSFCYRRKMRKESSQEFFHLSLACQTQNCQNEKYKKSRSTNFFFTGTRGNKYTRQHLFKMLDFSKPRPRARRLRGEVLWRVNLLFGGSDIPAPPKMSGDRHRYAVTFVRPRNDGRWGLVASRLEWCV